MVVKVLRGVGAAVLLAAIGTACAPTGDVQDPAVRRLTWFSYISGDDMQCETGIDRMRLVHNAIWDEDVRVVEATEVPGADAKVSENLLLRIDWTDIRIDPEALRAPWRGEVREGAWSKAQYAAVVDALKVDGAFTPLAQPLALKGQGFFWTGAGCVDGKRWFHAWAYPSAAYDALTFPKVLEGLVPSGKAFAVAHPIDQPYPEQNPKASRDFTMNATSTGISGRLGLPRPPLNRFLP